MCMQLQALEMVGVAALALCIETGCWKTNCWRYAVCILTMVESITPHYPFQMSLINNGAFHFKVVRRQRLDNSSLSDECL